MIDRMRQWVNGCCWRASVCGAGGEGLSERRATGITGERVPLTDTQHTTLFRRCTHACGLLPASLSLTRSLALVALLLPRESVLPFPATLAHSLCLPLLASWWSCCPSMQASAVQLLLPSLLLLQLENARPAAHAMRLSDREQQRFSLRNPQGKSAPFTHSLALSQSLLYDHWSDYPVIDQCFRGLETHAYTQRHACSSRSERGTDIDSEGRRL